ncbi:hypothetical protein QFZ37_000392 [Chryseobacterium ginsenosidimutans]|uniref:hypothetical protein n=1 Tax=Chryseobacterium ginsenosidimutans TaxID=687846 RepID=UPI00277F094C|nr:hypothetical protein [Chryseobacterium ginsenosidimutans]MDQ0592023.1 hypothetical protein [Chryseobacterium ginsenosidimutans]
MSNIGKIIRVNALPPVGERETNVIYQVAAPGAATYTDYAVDANGDLKTHAVVDGSIPVELSDNHVSISDLGFISQGITTQAEYNLYAKGKIQQKLNKPTSVGNALDYPQIVGMDSNGNVAKLPAGDLGKNIANSSLTSIADAGLTLGADWFMNTSGKNYTISGLPDVSNDSAFNVFLSQNTSGKIGKTNGKQPFLSLPSTLSNSEKTAWKTAMNGGWTTNTMSVGTITPPIVDKQDKNYWLSLRGTNLNLQSTSFSIDIMAVDGITKIATIPNSQIQLYNNGLDLSFYYNFKNLLTGQYKLRLWNGVAYYVTPMTIKVVDILSNFNLSNLVWETKLYTPGTPNVVTVSGGTMNYNASSANKPFAKESIVVAALKSSEFAAAGQNFVMSGTLRLRETAVSLMNIIFGVIDTQNSLALSNNASFQISIECNNIANYTKTIKGDSLIAIWTANDVPISADWSIARNGNIFTVIIKYAGTTYIDTKIGIQDALSLVCYINNSLNIENSGSDAGFNIQSAYLF